MKAKDRAAMLEAAIETLEREALVRYSWNHQTGEKDKPDWRLGPVEAELDRPKARLIIGALLERLNGDGS